MKVLYLLNRIPWPLKDGGAIAMYSLMKGLALQKIEITALAFNTNKHFVDNDTIQAKLGSLATWHTISIDTSIRLSGAMKALLNNQSYHAIRFYNENYERKLITLLQNQTFDFIVCDSIFMAQYIYTIRKYSRATTVLRQHNVEWRIWESLAKQTTNRLKKWYLKVLAKQLHKFETHFIQQFDKVVSITDEDAVSFRKMGVKVPIHTCPVGIAISEQPIYADTSAVFHLGSMEWQPNVEGVNWFLNKVWPKVVANIPHAQCFIAGRGMPDNWKQRIIQGVYMVGEVQDASIFMQNKSIMIVPIFAGSGIRVKILEGMRAGKAIVTTSVGVHGIPCKPNKHLLVADDENTFANHIISLIHDNQKRKQLGSDGFDFVASNYEISSVAKQLIDYITYR
jgi:glycosyltransferase involved in cell wall biosynthesis